MKRFISSRWLSLLIVPVMLVGMLAVAVQPVYAAEIINNGNIAPNQVINDDVVIGGQDPVIDGQVNGVVVAAGQTVTINGTVTGDVFAFGRTVTLTQNAKIDGNLFTGAQFVIVQGQITGSVFGGSATLDLSPSASVGRNLFYGGYSLTTQAGSKINTDLYGGMAQAIIKGDLGRDAILSANAVELSGKIGRNARLNVSEPGNNNNNNMSMSPFFQQSGMPPAISSGLRIAASSTIGGKLTYTSPMDQSQAIQNQPQGGIVFQTPVPDQNTNQAQAQRFNPAWNFFNGVLNLLRNLITLLILGALALWLLPGLFTNVVDHAAAKPLQASGYGLITVVVGFVGAFLAGLAILLVGIIFSLVTLGGLSSAWFGIGFSGLAVVFTAFVLLINYGSKLVVSYLVGRWLVSKIAPQSAGSKVWPLLVGVVVYVILRAIPILGWLIALVVTLVGMGAMWLAYTTRNNHAVVEAPQA